MALNSIIMPVLFLLQQTDQPQASVSTYIQHDIIFAYLQLRYLVTSQQLSNLATHIKSRKMSSQGGYRYTYRCEFWSSHNCDNWVYMNGERCHGCIVCLNSKCEKQDL